MIKRKAIQWSGIAKISYVSAAKSSQDVYGRLLAYVYLNDCRCVNQEIVKAGYAKTFYKYKCDQVSLFVALNAEARQEQRGNYKNVLQF